jgi:predicted acetyltransferase
MNGDGEVVLKVAASTDAAVLANLLELYSHDLSDVFGLELGPNGRFGYEKLPLYWSDPGRRFPFFIHAGDRLSGFALATQGPSASDDQAVFDVAEFFVVRRYRRCGVGRRAAILLWNRFPARWTVRVAQGNEKGLRFWADVVAEYAGDSVVQTTRAGGPHTWHLFSFSSVKR